MAITKIVDGYYYGTQEDLKPLLLGGAEKDAIYCAIDSGAVYKGAYMNLGRSAEAGAPCYLRFVDMINKGADAPKPLVNSADFANYNLTDYAKGLVGKKVRLISMIENLLIKNSIYKEVDATNGYTRTGSQIVFEDSQESGVVKSLNVYADEVESLAIVVANNTNASLASGVAILGYLDDSNVFQTIKSVESIASGEYRAYRDVKIMNGSTVVPFPHKKLMLKLTDAATDISVLVADEKYAAGYNDWGLYLLTEFEGISNIVGKYKANPGSGVKTFSDVELIFSMSVLKAASAEKFAGIEDNRYSATAGDASSIVLSASDDEVFYFTGTENTGGAEAKGIMPVAGIAAILD